MQSRYGTYVLSEFGGVGDDTFDNTPILQSLIDRCYSNGGGTICIPAGRFRSGTVVLKDNVGLYLEAGAELRAVEDMGAFPILEPTMSANYKMFFRHALIYAESAHNISIDGAGTLDGRGDSAVFARKSAVAPERYMHRPALVRLVDSSRVRIKNISIRDAASWSVHLMHCQDVHVHGITLHSRGPNYNNDGIDIDSCEAVRVSDCTIDSEDDAISIKATSANPCRRVLVSNCTLSSNCNAVRVGAENFGGFEDIRLSNCTIHDSAVGIAFQNIDGYPMRGIAFNGFTLRGVGVPIYMITNRKSYPVGIPLENYEVAQGDHPHQIEDISFTDIQGYGLGHYRGVAAIARFVEESYYTPAVFSGHPEARLCGLTLSNVRLRYETTSTDAGVDKTARVTDPNEELAPGKRPYPVFGLLIRHACKVAIHNLVIESTGADPRPAVGLENVTNALLAGVHLPAPADSAAIRTFNCSDIDVAPPGVLTTEEWPGPFTT